MLLSLLMAAAFAETVPVVFTPSAQVRLFTSVSLFNGTGTVKTGDCNAAFVLALADATDLAIKRKNPDLLAVFPMKDLSILQSADTLDCEIKGDPAAPKGAVVKLKLLAGKPGSDDGFPTITPLRATEIVASQIHGNTMIWGQVEALEFDARNGKVYLLGKGEMGETLTGNRNNKAVRVLRESVQPRLAALATDAAKVDEVAGVHVYVPFKTLAEGKEVTEVLHFYILKDKAQAFVSGNISEQELVNASDVLLGGTKIDISFVDAAQ